jgi:hypothetical protein
VSGYAGEDSGDFLFVIADERIVREAYAALLERSRPKHQPEARVPPLEMLPKNQQDAYPSRPSPPAPPPASRAAVSRATVGSPEKAQSFQHTYQSTLGRLLAWVTVLAALLLAVGLAAWLVPGFGELLIRIIAAVAKKS